MAAIWSAFIELFQVGIFGLTHFYGGSLAAAILSFSLLARLALLPISVRLTLRAREHARRVRALKPDLDAVRERFRDAPEQLGKETMAVYTRHGVPLVDGGALKGSLMQMPIFLGLFHAVRRAIATPLGEQGVLWMRSLARPDMGIAAAATMLAAAGAAVGSSETQPAWVMAIPTLSTGVMALLFSAGFGLYLTANGMVGLLQGLIVRRIEQERAPG